jgi:hypothetical protein
MPEPRTANAAPAGRRHGRTPAQPVSSGPQNVSAASAEAPQALQGPEEVEVNLHELNTRVKGNNLALGELEAQLDHRRAWTAEQLAPLLARLATLASRQKDLELFRDLVEPPQRERLVPLESPRAAIGQMAACIVAARQQVQSPSYPGTPAEQQAELRQLEGLSRALAELGM